MTDAQIVAAHLGSRYIYKKLRANNLESIPQYLKQLDPTILNAVTYTVFSNLAYDLNTPNLDVVFKKALQSQQVALDSIWVELLPFRQERYRIEHELEGYPKYQHKMALMGKDPVTYEKWVEIQEYLEWPER